MEFSYSTLQCCLLVCIVFIVLYLYFKHKANYWSRRGVNGPKPLPIIGNLFDNVFTAQNILEEQRLLKYGRIYGTLQGWKPVITVAEPELLRNMLVTDFRAFMNHRQYFSDDPFLSTLLSELNDDEWRRVKSIMSPAFTSSRLKQMQSSVQTCAKNTITYFEKVAEGNSEIDTKFACLSFTIDVVAKCVFGVETNSYENPNSEFIRNAHEMVTINVWRIFGTLLLPPGIKSTFDLQFFPRKLVNYFRNLIKEAINQRRLTKADHHKDFISLLLNAELRDTSNEGIEGKINQKQTKKLSETEIQTQCFMLLFAGYETTATSLYFLLYSLAMNPRVQQSLFDEIHTFLQSHKIDDFDSLNALPYLDAVMNENLRKTMPFSSIEHLCTQDYKLGDTGVTIEKGTILSIPHYAMYHDPQLLPNPHEFIPERFLPENRENIVPHSFNPFGCGPRMCVGYRFAIMIMKIFVANFVASFEVVQTENTPKFPKFTGKFGFVTCKPLYVTIKKRR